jgi:hypothetical protein
MKAARETGMVRIPSDRPGGKGRHILKWVCAGLPLGSIIWASFLPLPSWMQQVLILLMIIWFYAFFLLDCLFMGG